MPLSRKAKRVYGIDVQEELLQLLAEKTRTLGISNIELRLGTGTDIPLDAKSVDLIVSINTLHEFAHRKRMIEAMGRVLKRGGRVLTVDFKKVETGFGPPVSIRVSEVQATKLFEEKGFASVTKQDYPYHYLRVFSKRKV